MAFEFKEELTLLLPDVKDQLETTFGEAAGGSKKMVINVAAIHAGLTSNYNMYLEEELEKSINTWVSPYPKPIILNHDVYTEPVGRVMGAKMEHENDQAKTAYIALQVAISAPDAVEKVDDGRYLTGSVGGRATEARCSICDKDWAKASMFEPACKHQRGKVYNGKLAYYNLKGISWKEYSFVNVPADENSGVRANVASESEDGWVKPIGILSVDMDNESIMSIGESDSPHELLTDMRKKDAHAWYLHLKGGFLQASAYDYMDNAANENSGNSNPHTTIDNETAGETAVPANDDSVTVGEDDMTKPAEEASDDILSVAEQLSADLASTEEEETVATDTADAEETTDVVADAEAPATESDTPADAEESSDNSDTETDTEVTEATDTEEATEDAPAEELPADNSAAVEPAEADADAASTTEEDENPLQATVTKLTEENARLRGALHGMLAERVVDTKIALGLVEADNRADAIKEHSTRTPSSLADSIRDLGMLTPGTVSTPTKPDFQLDQRSVAADPTEENTSLDGDEVVETDVVDSEKQIFKKREDFWTDVMTGRKAPKFV